MTGQSRCTPTEAVPPPPKGMAPGRANKIGVLTPRWPQRGLSHLPTGPQRCLSHLSTGHATSRSLTGRRGPTERQVIKVSGPSLEPGARLTQAVRTVAHLLVLVILICRETSRFCT